MYPRIESIMEYTTLNFAAEIATEDFIFSCNRSNIHPYLSEEI